MSSAGSRNKLLITYRGQQHHVDPSGVPYLMGRDLSCQLRLDEDRKVSRHACSIRSVGGGWTLENISRSHSCAVDVPGRTTDRNLGLGDHYELESATTLIKIDGTDRPHLITVQWLGAPQRPEPAIAQPLSRIVTAPSIDVTANDHKLLAAKFLSRPTPGKAVGNLKAAEIVNLARAEKRLPPSIRHKAVENAVSHLRERLRKRDTPGIGPDDGPNALGFFLVRNGVLKESDRLFEPDDLFRRGVLREEDMS